MIVVGAPVHQRGWILQDWFDALANQDGIPAGELTVVLNYGPGTDNTLNIIHAEHRFASVRICQSDVTHQADRSWNLTRYEVMARLRNDLLCAVRQLSPDYFLSCDTDMILPSNTLQTLVEILDRGVYDGIAPLAYMTTYGLGYPNVLAEDDTRKVRPGITDQYAVFGTVLMNRTLLDVDYTAHPLGEDLGWAANVRRQGLRLGHCADLRVKHVMDRTFLQPVDPRIGF